MQAATRSPAHLPKHQLPTSIEDRAAVFRVDSLSTLAHKQLFLQHIAGPPSAHHPSVYWIQYFITQPFNHSIPPSIHLHYLQSSLRIILDWDLPDWSYVDGHKDLHICGKGFFGQHVMRQLEGALTHS